MLYRVGQKVTLVQSPPRIEQGAPGVVINYYLDISGYWVVARFENGIELRQLREEAIFWPEEVYAMYRHPRTDKTYPAQKTTLAMQAEPLSNAS